MQRVQPAAFPLSLQINRMVFMGLVGFPLSFPIVLRGLHWFPPPQKVDSRQSSKACQTQVITSPSMGLGLANCCAGISRGDIPTMDLGPGRLIRLIHLRSSDLYRFVPTRRVVQKASHGSQERLAEEAFQFAAWLFLSESYGFLVSIDPFPRTQSELL